MSLLKFVLVMLVVMGVSAGGVRGQEAGDTCATAGVLTESGRYTFDTTDASSDDPCLMLTVIIHTVWYRYTAPADGMVTVDLGDSTFRPYMTVFGGETCPEECRNVVAASDLDDGSVVTFQAEAGRTYHFAIRGWSGADFGEGVMHLSFDHRVGDSCETARVLRGNGVYHFDTTDASSDDPCLMLTVIIPTVWYRFTAPANGLVEVDTCGSSFGGFVRVFEGRRCPTKCEREVVAGDGCNEGAGQSFRVEAGRTYHLAVRGRGGADWGPGVLNFDYTPEIGIRGDINGDGVVNVADVTMLENMLRSGVTPPLEHGDLTQSGAVTFADVQMLAEMIVND